MPLFNRRGQEVTGLPTHAQSTAAVGTWAEPSTVQVIATGTLVVQTSGGETLTIANAPVGFIPAVECIGLGTGNTANVLRSW